MGISAQQMLQNDPEYLAKQLAQQEIAQFQNFQNPQIGLAATSGALLGRGIANLFNDRGFFDIADPALRRVSETQRIYSDVMKEFDPEDPATSYGKMAKMFAEKGLADPARLAAAEAAKYRLQQEELGIKRGTAARDARREERDLLKFYKENPEQTGPALQALAKQLEADPTNPVLLDRYTKIASAGTSGSIEAATKSEKEALDIERIQTTIKKNKAELDKLGTDFDAGTRWNAEREAALALFRANNLDPNVPLKGAALVNTELVNAQKIALRQPWTGAPMPTPPTTRPTTGSPGVVDFNSLPPTRK